MVEKEKPAASLKFWNSKINRSHVERVSYGVFRRIFLDQHRLFRKFLPRGNSIRFLEIGCYPGGYLWYFSKYFGYEVSGIEYVEHSVAKIKKLLDQEGVDAEIIQADFFELKPDSFGRLWDVVASFGFIEHFQNYSFVIRKHLDLVKAGGYLVLTVPLITSLHRRVFQKIAPEEVESFYSLSCADILDTLSDIEDVEILEAGYFGGVGLQNFGIPRKFADSSKMLRFIIKASLFGFNVLGQFLPNNRYFSPTIAVVARKLDTST
jgi:2-polyprenyl-3-methyl-5-hydroxy-6-metoxy-1,4-benzoquinol methylase